MAQLQPLVFGLAEELLSVSLELNAARLQQVLDSLTQQVRSGRETWRILDGQKSDAKSCFVAFLPSRSDRPVCSRAERRAGEKRPAGDPHPALNRLHQQSRPQQRVAL